jgi:hypothetical protein
MAVFAGIGTGDMTGTLTGGGGAVMAGIAGSGHCRMVHSRFCPGGRRMAVFTASGTRDVVPAFTGDHNAIVTDFTFGWCNFVHLTYMATFTFNISMGTCQVKTCSEMIGYVPYSDCGK